MNCGKIQTQMPKNKEYVRDETELSLGVCAVLCSCGLLQHITHPILYGGGGGGINMEMSHFVKQGPPSRNDAHYKLILEIKVMVNVCFRFVQSFWLYDKHTFSYVEIK